MPVRLELGPRDLADGAALMSIRLGEGKAPVSLDSAPAVLLAELTAFQDLLLRRATELPGFAHGHGGRLGRVRGGGHDRLGARVPLRPARSARTTSRPRPRPPRAVIPAEGAPEQGVCVRCGLPSAYGKRLIFGRSY